MLVTAIKLWLAHNVNIRGEGEGGSHYNIHKEGKV